MGWQSLECGGAYIGFGSVRNAELCAGVGRVRNAVARAVVSRVRDAEVCAWVGVASSWYRIGETSIVLGVELSGPIFSEPSRTPVVTSSEDNFYAVFLSIFVDF
jgi:hypothetical protein